MKRINIVKLILTVTVGGATVETIIAIVRKFANTIDYSLEWGVQLHSLPLVFASCIIYLSRYYGVKHSITNYDA